MIEGNGRRVLLVVIVAALAASVGIYTNVRLRAPAMDHAVELVPRDARAYVHVFLKPSTSQRRALQDLLRRFPGTDEDEEAKAFVTDALREALARFDIAVADDAAEWVGDEAAAYLERGAASPTILLEVDDRDEARAALSVALAGRLGDELTLSFIDDFAVVGHEGSGEASRRARDGSSLASTESYAGLVDDLDAHRVALFYTDGPFGPRPIANPTAAIVRFTPSEVVVDAVADGGRDAWRALQGFFTVSLMETRGKLVLDPPAEMKPTRLVLAAVDRLTAAGVPLQRSKRGFVAAPPAPLPRLAVRRHRGTVRAIIGPSAAPRSVPPHLVQAAEERLGPGFAPLLVVDASGLPAGARAPFFGPGAVSLRPPLEQFLTLDLGVKDVGSRAFARLVIAFSDS